MTPPFCCDCGQHMRCAKNDAIVDSRYGILHGDRYECPGCKGSIVTGFGKPIYFELDVAAYRHARDNYDEWYDEADLQPHPIALTAREPAA